MKTKAILLLGAGLLAQGLGAVSFSDTDRFLRSRSRPKTMDRETLKQELTETMLLVESLSVQLAQASPEQVEEVWASGPRDFKLSKSAVGDCRASAKRLLKALALEKEGKPAQDERDAARKKLVDLHKKAPESFLRDLRNWLLVSEGELRKAKEAR